MTDLKKCVGGARDRCQAAGANQLGQSIPIFEPEVVSRETLHAGEAQANSVDGASHGLGARPASANVLIAAALPIALQADGTNAARSELSDIAKWGGVPGKCKRLDHGRSDSTSAATCISS